MKTKTLLSIIVTFCVFNLAAQIVNVPVDYISIQSGIDAAEDGDTVLVSDGTYFENINFKGKAITIASHYIIDENPLHVISTIIDGSQSKNADTGSTVRFVSGEDTTSILFGFTIKGGIGTNTLSGVIYKQMGGGILCFEAGAKIVKNRIINNSVFHSNTSSGGGIACSNISQNRWIVIQDNIINNNTSTGLGEAWGAGIHIVSDARVSGNTFKLNECISNDDAYGGAVAFGLIGSEHDYFVDFRNNVVENNSIESDDYVYGAGIAGFSSEIIINNNSISGNSCYGEWAYGAGIAIRYTPQNGETQIKNNNISNNELTGLQVSAGSAIYLSNVNSPSIIFNNMITGNILGPSNNTYGTWGTVFSYDAFDNRIVLDGNVIANNKSNVAGGFYTRNSYNLYIINNAFLHNSIKSLGGAIYLYEYLGKSESLLHNQDNKPDIASGNKLSSGDYQPVIANNTIAFNSTSEINGGGAIYLNYMSEPVVSFNNIFWQNTDNLGLNDVQNDGTEMYIGYSIIDPDNISGSWEGEENISVDPVFKQDTFHIEITSPGVDAGSESVYYKGEQYFSPDYDIDEDERPLGEETDIGADEKIPLPNTPVALEPSDIGVDYFIAEWEESDLATGYYIDVAWDEDFEIMAEGYDNLDVGDVLSYDVTGLVPGYPFYYRLRAYNSSGSSPNSNVIVVLTVGDNSAIPYEEQVVKVFPNPFNNRVAINFNNNEESEIQLLIYNASGQQIETLANSKLTKGEFNFYWNATDYPGGVYYVKLITNNSNSTIKLMHLK